MNDIWVMDLARNVRTRLTFGPVSNTFPVWSPDGKWIAYSSDRNGHANIYRKPSDGSGVEELLLIDDEVCLPSNWSPDGKTLFYSRGPAGGNFEVWALPIEGDRKPRQVIPHSGNSSSSLGQLSPNGKWMAYMSSESGSPEIYVVAYGGGQGKWQVSTSEGTQPKWSKDGKELYYVNDFTRVLAAVPVTESNGALQFGVPQTLATTPATQQFIYDVSPDGKRILLNVVAQQVNQSVTVIANFPAGLRKE
jgi:Tol biopolymer transport system component